MTLSKDTLIKEKVKKAYGSIAVDDGQGCCGRDRLDAGAISKRIGYNPEEIAAAPDGANLGLGCGNPTAISELRPGESVLDLGSGAGFDCFLAAKRVGESGRVIGVDMTPEMVRKARANATKAGYSNVEFRQGDIEELPVDDNSIDVVISNCVINLSPDKERVFGEIYRVLKPRGRAVISDIALKRSLPEAILNSVSAYVGCVSGALKLDEYVDVVSKSGLQDIKMTVNSVNDCGGPDSQDPVIREIMEKVGDPQALLNAIVSVNVVAVKAGDAGQ